MSYGVFLHLVLIVSHDFLILLKVLKPPKGTILSTLILSKNSNFTTLLTAVKRAGLEQVSHFFKNLNQ